MTTLLTFLGTAPYSKATYVLGKQKHVSCYCPAAIASFFRPERTLVVVTEAAEAKHFEPLADEIASISQPVPVPIPDGHSEKDLWAIFDALTEKIKTGDELVVDITNGFRSLPFLSFLAVAFLQVAREVRVKGIYYGAWDARDPETGETPVFDLTPFATLLDWTTATKQFLVTGDGYALAEQLKEAHNLPWQTREEQQTNLPRQLNGMATIIETVSRTLRLARPEQTMKEVAKLQDQLPRVRTEAEVWAKPFHQLLDRTAADYAPLALANDPRTQEFVPTSLDIQRNLVKWYVDRRQYIQAVVLAREWVVSYVTLLLDWDLIKDRNDAENLLNASIRLKQKGQVRLETTNQAELDTAIALW